VPIGLRYRRANERSHQLKEEAWESDQSGVVSDLTKLVRNRLSWSYFGFDLLVAMNQADNKKTSPEVRIEILKEVNRTIAALNFILASTMVNSARNTEERADLDAETDGRLFPWLAGKNRSVIFHVTGDIEFPLPGFDVEKPLAGQSSEINAYVSIVKIVPVVFAKGVDTSDFNLTDPNFGMPIGLIGIDSVSFDEGSLYSWIKGRVEVLTLATALLAIGVPPGVDVAKEQWKIHEFHTTIQSALKDQPAVKYRAFQFADDELKRDGERAFNYAEPGISADERQHRIALTQLALKVALGTQVVIDGILGPETCMHEKRFGALHNLPPNIKNPFFRAELLKALQARK
jgi:hypothetical protein